MPDYRVRDKCPDCKVKFGRDHEEWCDIQRCSVCGEQRLGCECEGHNASQATWMGGWPFPTEDEDEPSDGGPPQQEPSYAVDLGALRPWLADHVDQFPPAATFKRHEDAKGYAEAGLQRVIDALAGVLAGVRAADSFEAIHDACPTLVCHKAAVRRRGWMTAGGARPGGA